MRTLYLMRRFVFWLLFLLLAVSSYAQTPAPAAFLIERAVQLLEENYAGFVKFDGVALEKSAKQKLGEICKDLPRCEYAQGVPVLEELIASLGDGHTFRMSSLRRAEFDANQQNRPLRGVGLKFAPLPDAPALVVTRVLEGSPAHKAGIKRGDVVLGVNGSLERFASATQATTAITELEATAANLEFVLRGNSVPVVLEPVLIGPWLPSLAFVNDVAVVTFYQYLTPLVAARVQEHIRAALLLKAKAIVLDVRGSGGGSAFESMGSAGAFVQPVGTRFEVKNGIGGYEFRNGSIFAGNTQIWNLPNFVRWEKPVLVLTNRISRSAAEYMTYFLQRPKRAVVLGERTAGVLNTSTNLYPLPDGSTLAITAGRSSSLDGQPHPEFVTPDIVLPDDMAALAAGRDLILERAIGMLR
jgi:carboxyl-terminal processing protease